MLCVYDADLDMTNNCENGKLNATINHRRDDS